MFLLLCLTVFAVIALGPKLWRINDHITLCFDDYDPRISDPVEREKVCKALAEDI
jgi:hypothetical protein